MKLTVENTIVNYLDDKVNYSMLLDYNEIINRIFFSENKQGLENNFKTFSSIYFSFGFGGSHFWVKQLKKGRSIKPIYSDCRILICIFD